MKKLLLIIPIVITTLTFVSGCLLTVGTPLSKRVEPNTLRVEGSTGITISDEPQSPGFIFYAYGGKSFGRHFEIGILPFLYSINSTGILGNMQAGAIGIPLKWDPINYSNPFHIILYIVPTLYTTDFQEFVPLLYDGIGISYNFNSSTEAYVSYSIPYYAFQLFTLSTGLRYTLLNNLTIDAGFTYLSPIAYGLTLSLQTTFR